MKRPILLATDFSEASAAATEAAVALARRLDAPIEIVHVLEHVPVESVATPDFGVFAKTLAERARSLEEAMRDAMQKRLDDRAAEIARKGVPATARVLATGRPWDAVAALAEQEGAALIVMGTHGFRGPRRWILGSVAERTVRAATCPVLVVPAALGPGLAAWADGTRPLRVAMGLDLGEREPLALVRELRSAAACDVTATHLYWPPAEMRRSEVTIPFDLEAPPAEIQARIERELRETVGALPGKGGLSFLVRPEWGRLSDPLIQIAHQLGADLLVLGTHGRHVLDGFGAGSTAFGVLKRIDLPVAFVPAQPKTPA